MDTLSADERNDLRIAISKEAGVECANNMSNQDRDEIGMFLLTVLAEGIKLRINDSTRNI